MGRYQNYNKKSYAPFWGKYKGLPAEASSPLFMIVFTP